MATPIRIQSRLEGADTAVLSLAGEIDVANVAQVRSAAVELLERGATSLIVDLSAIEYIDSSGMGMLVGLKKRLADSNGNITIVGVGGRVKRVFEVTGLERIFTLSGSVEAALKEVQ
jgi:anti-sigma B factor antagonist